MNGPRLLALLLLIVPLTGCRSPRASDAVAGTTSATMPDYASSFASAKDVLRDLGFELDRIDAHAGVITTRPRIGSGYATPWITSEHPLDDLAHRQRRIARITFRPVDADTIDDLRTHDGPVNVEWVIRTERVFRPGRRPSPTSVRLGGSWRDLDSPLVDGETRYAVPIDDDLALAGRALQSHLEHARRDASPAPSARQP